MRDDEYYQNDADKRTKEYKDWKALKETQIEEAEKITKATGIKAATKAIFGEDCGCDGRQESLNNLMPFGITAVECVDQDDFMYLKSFFSITRTRVDRDNQLRLVDIYNHVFNQKMVAPSGCATCSKKGFIKAINALHAYYDASVIQINNTKDEKNEQ